MSRVVWITARPRDPATAAQKIVRLAGGGSLQGYVRGNEHYRAGVATMPRFRAEIGFDEDGWDGATLPATGNMEFRPAQAGLLDELAALYWNDAPIEIDAGPEGGPYARVLTGTVKSAPGTFELLAIEVTVDPAALGRPVVKDRFAGTGGVEGGSEAGGRLKRRSWGRVFNVEGRIFDKANNIFEFGDPARPLQAFATLRDKGRQAVPAPQTIAWQGSLLATLDALKASVPVRGSGVVAPSIACAKWWTQPAGPLTADLHGEIGAGYVETAPEIAAALAAAVGGPAIANVAATVAARGGAAGLHIGEDNETGSEALDRLLLGVSLLWILEPAGTIRLREIGFAAPVETLVSLAATRQRRFAPIKRRRVAYQRSHRIHNDGEIAPVLLLDRGDWAAGTTYNSGEFFKHLGSSYAVLAEHVASSTAPPPNANVALISLSAEDQQKLDGVEPGATAGATAGVNVRDPATGEVLPVRDILNGSMSFVTDRVNDRRVGRLRRVDAGGTVEFGEFELGVELENNRLRFSGGAGGVVYASYEDGAGNPISVDSYNLSEAGVAALAYRPDVRLGDGYIRDGAGAGLTDQRALNQYASTNAQGTGSLFFNQNFDLVDPASSPARPAGLRATSGTSTVVLDNEIAYAGGVIGGDLSIGRPGANGDLRCWTPMWPCNPKARYRARGSVKKGSASGTDGFFVRFCELDGTPPASVTHIAYPGAYADPALTGFTREIATGSGALTGGGSIENSSALTTDYQPFDIEIAPTPSARFMGLETIRQGGLFGVEVHIRNLVIEELLPTSLAALDSERDLRITRAVDANGDLLRNITSSRRDSSNLLGRTGGGAFTGELNATDGAIIGTNVRLPDNSVAPVNRLDNDSIRATASAGILYFSRDTGAGSVAIDSVPLSDAGVASLAYRDDVRIGSHVRSPDGTVTYGTSQLLNSEIGFGPNGELTNIGVAGVPIRNDYQRYDQVVPGFGRPADNAGSNFNLVTLGTGTFTRAGNGLTRSDAGKTDDWGNIHYSTEFMPRTAFVSGRLRTRGTTFGLSQSPTSGGIADLNSRVVPRVHWSSNGSWYAGEGASTAIGAGGWVLLGTAKNGVTFSANTQWAITYDNGYYRWFADKVEMHSVAAAANLSHHFAACLGNTNSSIDNLQFGAYTDANWNNFHQVPTELKDGRIPAGLNAAGYAYKGVTDTAEFGSGSGETVSKMRGRASGMNTNGRARSQLTFHTSAIAGVKGTNDVALTAVDAGDSTTTISIPMHERRAPGETGTELRTYNSGSITGLAFSTLYFVYTDDPEFQGGARTYVATTNSDDLTNGAARVAVGKITTPASGGTTTGDGGGSGGGGGGGLVSY